MMDRPNNPLPTSPQDADPRQAGGLSKNPASLRAVVGLGCILALVGGIVVISARQSPRGVSASVTQSKGMPARAGGVQAALDAAAKYQGEGKFGEAAAILGKLVETDATDQPSRVAYARALMGEKKYNESYAQYEAALALMPAGTIERMAKDGDSAAGQLQFEAGTCANMAGRIDRAEEHYSMAQTADRREPKYPLYLAMIQLKKGGKENDTAATASLLRATHLNPELGEAWGTLAEIALRNDQVSIAEQHIQMARKLQPDVVRWRVVEARLLNRRGEAEQAAGLLTALPARQRSEPAILGVLAESYGLLRKPAEAARMYAEAFAASSPPNAELAYQAALWFERAAESAKAAEHAKNAAVLGHGDAKDLAARLAAGN